MRKDSSIKEVQPSPDGAGHASTSDEGKANINQDKHVSEAEIGRFFAAYSDKQRKWVERSSEYQMALKRGKTGTALEIASVVISYFDSGDYNQMRYDIKRIFKKEFPKIEIPN
jgi:hypothetical protein